MLLACDRKFWLELNVKVKQQRLLMGKDVGDLYLCHLVGDRVITEEDNFEEGLSLALIAAGIPAENIITGLNYQS